jgi:archaeosortase A (PGF-CTERM-specific)
MDEYLLFAAFALFVLFLIPGRHQPYTGIGGWLSMSLYLFAEIPYFLSINNYLYPTLALLSVPFLYVTGKRLFSGDEHIVHLTRAAAVAVLIYLPFAYTALGPWLIQTVIGQIGWCLSALGVAYTMPDIDMFGRNGLKVQIILGCTGIQSIAIMLGVAAAVPSTLRQKALASLLIVPTIYLLNIGRNVFVILAYTGQWFPYFPEIASNGEYGYESFFWAHNVLCELGALVALIVIAYALFIIMPGLAAMADGLYRAFRDDLAGAVARPQGSDLER